jgi:hypothetical protein
MDITTPRSSAADPFDLGGFDLVGLADHELQELAASVALEQHRRAVASADPDALVEEGFTLGFTPAGAAKDPWLNGGLLICPGVLAQTSKASHDCTFVSVKLPHDDSSEWVWEATDLVHDEVRVTPGTKRLQRSVTLVAVCEGMEIDVVVSQMRQGNHRMKQVRSFVMQNGELVHVSTRARKPQDGHR